MCPGSVFSKDQFPEACALTVFENHVADIKLGRKQVDTIRFPRVVIWYLSGNCKAEYLEKIFVVVPPPSPLLLIRYTELLKNGLF